MSLFVHGPVLPVLTVLVLSAGVPAVACAQSAVERVRVTVDLGTPYVLAGRTQRAYLKVGLRGGPLEPAGRRAPVNVSIVLDRSGSMTGQKIAKAKEAAITAIDRLGPDDIVSVVAYNHVVDVLVPATKVRDKASIYRQVDRLFASGTTALFAGVGKGAAEVRKFLDRNRVNRVVLLSDGLANVGPSSPGELAALGRALAEEGISVTTIGLGTDYNEDLMVGIAQASDGNHAFVESASDLARIFDAEFGDVLSVVARELTVRIRCAPGVRPIRVLGRHADVSGQDVVTTLSQVYANQEKYVLVEVELPAGASGLSRDVADLSVDWLDAIARSRASVARKAQVAYTDLPATVDANRNRAVTEASVELIATETNKAAMKLRDEGRVDQAQEVLRGNTAFLRNQSKALGGSKRLDKLGTDNEVDSLNLDEGNYKVQRKAMKKRQYEFDSQQAW